jgi:hypothetical protein
MNKKAEKFEKMLEENKIECFQKEEVKDELNTVLYRSFMEIEGLQLPVVVILDNSIYSIFRTLVIGKGVNEKNKNDVINVVNTLNSTYKSFKYIVSENGEIILDACVPCTDDNFDPNLIRVMIDVAIKNLNENYRKIVKTVWE